MTDENVTPPAGADTPDNTSYDRAHVGKIGRLPDNIRNQLNHRLLNGQSGSEIVVWLNELPHVKKILATHFDGAPVSHQNLTKWRLNGYQRWLKKQEHVAQTRELAQYAVNISQAGRGSLAAGAAAISLRVLGDARAKAIEASDCSYEEKIELIGHYLFDDLWDLRPTQPDPEHVTATQK